MVFEANPDYWGTKAARRRTSSSTGATRPPSGSSSCSRATSTASTTRAPTTSRTSRPTATLKFYPREGLNTFYIGFNNTLKPWDNEKVRQAIAMGIDRQQIVDNFYPEGSEVATHFTPCSIPFGCEGDATWDFDLDAAKRAPGRGRLRREASTSTPSSSSARRSAATSRTRPRSRTEIASQLKHEPRHQRDPRPPGVGRVPRRRRRGHPRRHLHARLGRRLPGSDELPRLPLRCGLGQEVRQAVRRHRGRAQRRARPAGRRRDRAGRLRRGQQPHQAARPRGHRGPRRAPAPRSRPTSRAPTPRRSATRSSR